LTYLILGDVLDFENVVREGLESLGLIKEKEDIKRFYPHNTSHWLGMDVHDIGLYKTDKKSRELKPGMVLTIEPGIYFQPGDKGVPNEYKNIGIRIEDDILITKDGCEVLSRDAPKVREEIENISG